MGKIKPHHKVKLIIGLIFKENQVYDKAKLALEELFGKIDFESQTIPFNHTDYYEKEFGKNLIRKFISFKKLISPEKISCIKCATNNIELNLSLNGLRRINIDPGYLDLAKLILVSTKDYKHRIYLTKGIFAEITLSYQNNTFQSWEWTYPDYSTQEYIGIFNRIRNIYIGQIKE